MVLREAGFIDKEALAESARLTGSREEKIMLASGDQAYIAFDKSKPLRAGERYSVFVADTARTRSGPPRPAPCSGTWCGSTGTSWSTRSPTGTSPAGTLLDLVEPVERGYAVSPKVRLFKSIEPKPAAANLEARIVASFSPTIMLAAENFVVLSRGVKDGLAVGNRIFVVRRGDGYRPADGGLGQAGHALSQGGGGRAVGDGRARQRRRWPGSPGPPRSSGSARWPSCARGTDRVGRAGAMYATCRFCLRYCRRP